MFDLRLLREFETRDPVAKGFFDDKGKFVADPQLRHGDDGISIWEWPDEGERYTIGVDIAQGLEHGDYTSVHVIACRSKQVVATYHGQIDPDLLGSEVLPRLGRFYHQALIGVESNQHGLTTLKFLAKTKYFPIYYERSPKYKKSVPTDVLGFRTSQMSKPLIIDELTEAMREGLGDSRPVHGGRTARRSCGRGTRTRWRARPYDDRTMSLAIANTMRKYVFFAEFTPDENPPPGSFGDWERRLYGESFKDLIGESSAAKPWGKRPERPKIGANYVRRRVPF